MHYVNKQKQQKIEGNLRSQKITKFFCLTYDTQVYIAGTSLSDI